MQQVDARLVTPEAVVLQFETAGLGSRFVARLLDTVIQAGILIAVAIAGAAAASGGFGSTASGIFVLFAFFAVLFVYPVAFETLWRGRTPGKAAIGLRVVTKEGAPVRFRHAAIRAALWLVEGVLLSGSVAVITILVTRDNVRLGDLAAGTLVLRERTGARAPTPASFGPPPGAEAYTASLDVSGLSGADYEAVRNLLLRAPSLDGRSRWEVAGQLGTYIAGRMRHSPPPGMAPELFLACVAAAYQRRFAGGPAAVPVGSPGGWGAPPPVPPPPGSGDFVPPA